MRTRRKTYRRGRTRPGRMRLIDQFLGTKTIPLPDHERPLVIDIGYGDEPITTLQLHEHLSAHLQDLTTVGIEADQSRVIQARDHESDQLRFVHGGFDTSALELKPASIVRCFNVLRGYGIWDVKKALLQMGAALAPGGLLIEGTTDVEGALLCCHLWQREAETMSYRGLLCATDFSRGFSPLMFRDVLPRDLRRHGAPGEPSFDWLCEWNDHVTLLREQLPREGAAKELNRHLFVGSAQKLAGRDPRTNATLAPQGALLFCPERPSTRPEVLSPDDHV